MGSLARHLRHHGLFYVSTIAGIATFFLLRDMTVSLRLVASGDLFFFAYLSMKVIDAFGITTDDLKARAEHEDEGIFLVVSIVLAAISVSSVAIINVLNGRHMTPVALLLSLAGVPLGWFTLHTLAAFHYTNLFYGQPVKAKRNAHGGLIFPGTEPPGLWEFLYFSFVIGMTAQTSDVQVTTTVMRRVTLAHAVASFFYNTLIIAMAVNAVIALAS
ncbi:MAG: DUF1345 domain-containing protein [Proteobacteria bacterium]|nr:DUF1345 domain-containing protein [Pseudomonadota bacterium]